MGGQRSFEGRSIVPGKKTGLQFSNRIPALKFREGRGTCEMALEPTLIKLIIVERPKNGSEAAKGLDEA